jgi:hypothetical protein
MNETAENNLENNNVNNVDIENNKQTNTKTLEPFRTEALKNYEMRKRRLDRQAIDMMPEIHFLGEVRGGKGIIADTTEGAMCRLVMILLKKYIFRNKFFL